MRMTGKGISFKDFFTETVLVFPVKKMCLMLTSVWIITATRHKSLIKGEILLRNISYFLEMWFGGYCIALLISREVPYSKHNIFSQSPTTTIIPRIKHVRL